MEFQLPKEFTDRMQKLLGEEWEEFFSCFGQTKYQAVRFNPLKKGLSSEKYDQILQTLSVTGDNRKKLPVLWAEHGFYYPDSAHPGKHPFHEMGLYYIQEPSAMSAAALLAPKPGMKVLDLCAAPGGKSTQLAAALCQEGILVANEIHPARCRILSQNIERMGISNAIVTNEDSKKLAGHFGAFFDAVLVDAPCSGEGMFRKNEEAVREWSTDNVKNCASRQREILDNAAQMLKSGGRLVYSTCTFAPEENEQTIASFLDRHGEFFPEDVETTYFSPAKQEWAQYEWKEEAASDNSAGTLKGAFRLWPHKLNGEGHFVAVLRKKGIPAEESLDENGSGENRKSEKKKKIFSKEQQAAWKEFSQDTLTETCREWIEKGRLTLFGDQLYRIPENMPDLSGIHVLRMGLHIGTFKKNRFEPSHALALYLGQDEVLCAVNLPLTDERCYAFFRGEGFSMDESKKGWCLVCIDGYSAGWGKCSGTQLKNHYPKGLRKDLKFT